MNNKNRLRDKALQWLDSQHKLENINKEELKEFFHEIDVYRVELEIQNEELRQAQEELAQVNERYRDLYENAPVGYLTVDFHEVVQQANLKAAWLADRGIDQIVKRPFKDLFVPENQESCREFIRNVLSVEAQQSREFRMNRQDGKTLWVKVDISLLPEYKWQMAGYRVTLSNITERKQAESDLQKAKEELEIRVQERTFEISQTVEELKREVDLRKAAEDILRQRTEQLEALAAELTLTEQNERKKLARKLHDELQQILVAAKFRISLFSRSLQDQSQQDSLKEAVNLIDESIDYSRSLVGDLNPPVLQQGGLIAALRWLADSMRKKHDLKVHLDLDESAAPESEEIAVFLFQSIKELLFNVVKHAKVKQATLSLKKVRNKVEIVISDEGEGFDPEEVLSETEESTGFGLYSIRERLNLLKGRLEVRSAPGKGSTFRILSPIQCPHKEEMEKKAAKVSVQIKKSPNGVEKEFIEGEEAVRVILVDDHTVMRQGLAQLLRETPGIQIVGEASDGAMAVDLVRELKPDVVTMDINLPKMNGIEATKIIHGEFPDIQVIGLSMFNEREHEKAMKEVGAAEYLTKSGVSEELSQTILKYKR